MSWLTDVAAEAATTANTSESGSVPDPSLGLGTTINRPGFDVTIYGPQIILDGARLATVKSGP